MIKGLLITITFSILNYLTSGTLTGTWKLIQYKDLTTGFVENIPQEYVDRKVVTFTFEDNNKTGKFNGRTVSNETGGKYILEPNNKIKVENFGGTKVGEDSWGGKFWNTIRQSTSYEIKNDTLYILYDHDTKRMTFIQSRN
jgi:hypothetical protein